MLALKNTTGATITAAPEFLPVGGSAASINLPPVTLGPYAATLVDLTELTTTAERERFDQASVRVWNRGPPGSLIGGLSAMSTDRARAYDVPLRDSGPVGHATGSYPWRIDGDYQTVVSITNVSGRIAKYHARLTYPGGVYWFNPGELDPGETTVFDIRELRDDWIPDMYGNTLPQTAVGGQFRWSVVKSRGETQLTGRAEIISAKADRSSSYSCWVCCPDHTGYGFMTPGTLKVVQGDVGDGGVLEHFIDCYGNGAGDYGAYPTSWWVQYTNVTNVWTVQTGTARASGNNAGSSQVSGSWNGEGYDVDYDLSECIYYEPVVDAPATVQTQTPTSLGLTYEQYISPQPGQLYNKERHYQVLDQNGQAITKSGMHITETWPSNQINGNCFITGPTPGQADTNSNGEFKDNYYLGTGAPNPCTSTAVQHHFVNGTQVSTFNATYTHSGVTIQ